MCYRLSDNWLTKVDFKMKFNFRLILVFKSEWLSDMGSVFSENNCTWLCHTMNVHFCDILVTQWLIFLTLLWHSGLLFLTSCAHICDTAWHFRDTVRSLLIPRSSILADIDTLWVKEAGFAHRRFPILYIYCVIFVLCDLALVWHWHSEYWGGRLPKYKDQRSIQTTFWYYVAFWNLCDFHS